MTENIFDRVNNTIRNTEGSLVNVLSAIAPWGAPLAPAVMVYHGMTTRLGFDDTVSFILAAVVEVLGLATVSTTLQFWQHNRKVTEKQDKMPVALAGGMFAFYLAIILIVNVLLEPKPWDGGLVAARTILSLLSVPAAVTLAIRAQYTERLKEITAANAKRNEEIHQSATNAQEETRLRLQMAMEKDVQIARIQAETKAQVSIARIEARAAATNGATMSGGLRQMTDIPTFRRGYDGFVDYMNWIDGQGGEFDKNHAAQTMGRSTRQIERYVEHGRNNGLADKFQ